MKKDKAELAIHASPAIITMTVICYAFIAAAVFLFVTIALNVSVSEDPGDLVIFGAAAVVNVYFFIMLYKMVFTPRLKLYKDEIFVNTWYGIFTPFRFDKKFFRTLRIPKGISFSIKTEDIDYIYYTTLEEIEKFAAKKDCALFLSDYEKFNKSIKKTIAGGTYTRGYFVFVLNNDKSYRLFSASFFSTVKIARFITACQKKNLKVKY